MSSLRIPYHSLSPVAYRAFASAETALEQSTLGRQMILLVFLRISQINGCAFCIDKHARDLLKMGEDWQRVNSLSTWRETAFYSAPERAALAWAEAVTRLENGAVPDAVFEALTTHFSDQEIADLGFASALMNAWNRMAISFRQPVPKSTVIL
ncbi:MAG TPA: carboxymuconolactone decarboxylase family protein [Noviherbaspirillum sp.]|uniref:carboxymuconolactone decarboxylase family protein n=1 Tax=Noviherbaspirillum sp. TaxID=1926288 RepID=UPI002F92942D